MATLFEQLQVLQEVYFKKRSSMEKRMVKKQRNRAHKGTNWKQLAPKAGMKRVKIASNRYVRVRLSPLEKTTKKIVGRSLGRATYLK